MIQKVFIAILLVAIGFLGYNYHVANNEIMVLNDSITTKTLANGELVSSKHMLEVELRDLRVINDTLYDQVKQLKENPIYVQKVKMVYKTDTIIAESVIDSIVTVDEKRYNIAWNHYDLADNLTIKGVTHVTFDSLSHIKNYGTSVDELSLDIELVGVLTKTKRGINYNVIPKSKNIRITSLDGYVIQNYKTKPKKFGVSLFTGPTYDFVHKTCGYSVGFGVTYDILQLF